MKSHESTIRYFDLRFIVMKWCWMKVFCVLLYAGTCASSWLLCTFGEQNWRRFVSEEESQDASVALLYLSSGRILPGKRKWTFEEPKELFRRYVHVPLFLNCEKQPVKWNKGLEFSLYNGLSLLKISWNNCFFIQF